MAIGTYKIPRPFKDEDKWFKLTKKQWLFLAFGAGLAYVAFKIFSTVHLNIVAYVVAIIAVGVCFIIATFNMPDDKYIIGGGTRLDILAKRLVIKRFKKYKKIYIKNYGGNQ